MVPELNEEYPAWGYFFHYPNIEHPGGAFQLDVYLTENPIGLDFNPKTFELSVETEFGGIEEVKLFYPLSEKNNYHVVAGMIEVVSHEGDRESALTFGGKLTLEKHDDYIYCKLVSPAPIYEITRIPESHMLLIEELEIIIAERKAALKDEKEFEKRLIKVDPLNLYIAISQTLIKKFKSPGYNRQVEYRRLARFLQDEVQRLCKLRKERLPVLPLEKIL